MRSALFLTAVLISALPRVPAAEESDTRSTLLFVPALRGAVTFGVEARGALERRLVSGYPTTAANAVLGHVGYRLYLEPHTRWSLGAYVAAGVTDAQAERVAATHVDFGLSLQARALSPDFFYWNLGLFGEAGPVVPRASGGGGTGLRWAAGLESGPGLLWYLDPWLLGDVVGRVGLQSVTAAGGDVLVLFAGLRFTLEASHR